MGNGPDRIGSSSYVPVPINTPATGDSEAVAPKPVQSDKSETDPATTARNSQAMKMHAKENLSYQSMHAAMLKNELSREAASTSIRETIDQVRAGRAEAKPAGGASTVKFQDQARLPGQMMTVTLLDARRGVIDQRTVPLYNDAAPESFSGEVKEKSISWDGNRTVNAKVGTKFDKKGNPIDGTSVENWAASRNARYVEIKIEDAKQRQEKTGTSDEPWFNATDDSRIKTPKKSSDAQQSSDAQSSKKSTNPHSSTGTGEGQRKDKTNHGDQDRIGQQKGKGQYGNFSEKGNSRAGQGVAYGRDPGKAKVGDRLGHKGGDPKPGGYFYEKDLAKIGAKGDLPDPKGQVKGIPGGEGGGDNNINGGLGIIPKVKVPEEVAPAVAVAIIVSDADIVHLSDNAVKKSIDMGEKAAGKGGRLSREIGKQLDAYADKQTAAWTDMARKDGTFKKLNKAQQEQMIKEAREEIREVAWEKLEHKLGKEQAELKTGIDKLKQDTSEGAQLAKSRAAERMDAAKRARESMPGRSAKHGPDDVVPNGQVRPTKMDDEVNPKTEWMNSVPADLRKDVVELVEELKLAKAGDKEAKQALQQRAPHILRKGEYEGWTAYDIKGRENPYRLITKEVNGITKWRVLDYHTHNFHM